MSRLCGRGQNWKGDWITDKDKKGVDHPCGLRSGKLGVVLEELTSSPKKALPASRPIGEQGGVTGNLWDARLVKEKSLGFAGKGDKPPPRPKRPGPYS